MLTSRTNLHKREGGIVPAVALVMRAEIGDFERFANCNNWLGIVRKRHTGFSSNEIDFRLRFVGKDKATHLVDRCSYARWRICAPEVSGQ